MRERRGWREREDDERGGTTMVTREDDDCDGERSDRTERGTSESLIDLINKVACVEFTRAQSGDNAKTSSFPPSAACPAPPKLAVANIELNHLAAFYAAFFVLTFYSINQY